MAKARPSANKIALEDSSLPKTEEEIDLQENPFRELAGLATNNTKPALAKVIA